MGLAEANWASRCGSLVAQVVKLLSTMRETWVQSLGREDHLEKEIATHSSIFAWGIPCTEDPGRLKSIDCRTHRVTKELDTTESLNNFCFVTSRELQWHINF